jgi:hypothetical protein
MINRGDQEYPHGLTILNVGQHGAIGNTRMAAIYPQRHIELKTGVVEEEVPENLKMNILQITQRQ